MFGFVEKFFKDKIVIPLIIRSILKYINQTLSKELNTMLSGKKTYIITIIAVVLAVGNIALKLLRGEPITGEDLYALLGALGLGSLRAAIPKK
jgi:hypothetical protein